MLCHVVRSRVLLRWIFGAVMAMTLALGSTEGRAVPIEYTATAGASVQILVLEGFTTPLTSQSIPLELTSTITIDSVTDELLGFDFSLSPGSVLSLSSAYGGYDQITLNSVEISSGPSFATSNVVSAGAGYTFQASGIVVDGEYVAADTGGGQPASPATPLPAFSSNLNGAYEPSTFELSFHGVQIALLPGAQFGESSSLLVQGTFSVTGGSPVVIPEPSTGILLAGGLLLLGSRRRSKSRLV